MSGSGTNIGIEYQQKVSAWFLLQMFNNSDISTYLRGLTPPFRLEQIHFESEHPIDDLNLFSTDKRIYAQIKHSISMSDSDDSEFASVIAQFVRAYKRGDAGENYLLITSSKSSRKVTAELSKILDSIRLNENSLQSNPLSISEKATLAKYRSVLLSETAKCGLGGENLFDLISSRIHIVLFDIEKNQPFEIATLMQIATLTDIVPELVWSNVVQKSLEFASKRLTVSRKGIIDILTPLIIKKDLSEGILSELPDWFNVFSPPDSSGLCSGVDFFFAKGLSEGFEGKHWIIELYRFDENGKERIQLSNDILKLKSSGLEFKVLFRCSTESRLVKFIESLDNRQEMEVVIMPGNFDRNVENNTIFARTHSEILNSKLPKRVGDFHCIHCAEFVSEEEILFIDYFEAGVPQIGCVHKGCRKGADRVVGSAKVPLFADHNELRMFNIEAWIQASIKSVNSLFEASRLANKSKIVSWDDKFSERSGKYCYSLTLSDGSKEYVHKRSKIDRASISEIDKGLEILNSLITAGVSRNDPFCYTSISRRFGNYSFLVGAKDPEDKILEAKSVAVEEFTLSIKNNYEKAEHFYAPVFYLEFIEDNKKFQLGQFFVLLTNPFEFSDYLSNWRTGGEVISEYRIVIVDDDHKFDNLLRKIFDEGGEILIDPLIDKNQNIIKGMGVKPLSLFNS